MASTQNTPSYQDFVDRARAMVPALRERAAAAEKARRIPDETQSAFVEAGLYKLFQPKYFGGYEMDYHLIVDVSAELGRGCGSSCWIFTNIVQHGLINGMKDPRAQEEVWGDNPDALMASATPGRDARVRLVDGGAVVEGTYHFSSGIDFADWMNIQLFLNPDGGPAEHRFAQVHKSDYEVIDDWFMTGLTATGSRSLRLKGEVYIPDYRMLSSLQVTGGPTPGSAISDSLLYQMPFWGIATRVFAGPAIGIARGMLEATEEEVETRVARGGVRLAEQAPVHVRLAESGAEVDAAWALLERDFTEAMRMTEAERVPTLLDRARWRRNHSYAVQLCLRSVDRMYALWGMRGMEPDSLARRHWNDIHALSNQVALAWDPQAGNYGRARFGLEFTDPRA